jgi:hypothetical protein
MTRRSRRATAVSTPTGGRGHDACQAGGVWSLPGVAQGTRLVRNLTRIEEAGVGGERRTASRIVVVLAGKVGVTNPDGLRVTAEIMAGFPGLSVSARLLRDRCSGELRNHLFHVTLPEHSRVLGFPREFRHRILRICQ